MSELFDPDGKRYWGETWAVSSYLTDIDFSGTEYAAGYTWAIKAFAELEQEPNLCSINGIRGFKSGWWETWDERARAKFEKSDIEKVKAITLVTTAQGERRRNFQMTDVEYSLRCRGEHGSFQNSASFLLRPKETGATWSSANRLFSSFANVHVKRYGYAFRLSESTDASWYAGGGSYGHGEAISQERVNNRLPIQHADEKESGWWIQYHKTVSPQTLLRNVYLMNFLTEPYLRLEIEGQKLGVWIESKPKERGTLEKINHKVTLWTPIWDNIPRLREELFRAGHIFYHRFFQTWEENNAWKRDFSKPWKCPNEIPRIFQRDYHHAIDPPLR